MSLYATQDEAAIAALILANPRSIRENKEYGGFIYRASNGGYGFTPPHLIGASHGNLDGVTLPPGAREVGMYHCHGAYTGPLYPMDPNRPSAEMRTNRALANRGFGPFGTYGPSNDQYSPTDLLTADERGRTRPGYRSYLGTPSGLFYRYDVRTSAQTLLPRYTPIPLGHKVYSR